MSASQTISRLAAIDARGPGTDAERRAAHLLLAELEPSRPEVRLEALWCRPNWALGHAWHAALGLVGSLIAVSAPRVGGGLILLALLSTVADAVIGASLGRRLSFEHASQNVVSLAGDHEQRVRLIITANYDAGRMGLVNARRVRALAAQGRRLGGGLSPGWLGWLVIALIWVEVVALIRLGGARSSAVGIAQVIPTAGLVIALALLLEQASSSHGPGAGDNGSGVAVALALARALDAAPPRRLAVEIVLAGAGEGGGIGLRRHLRGRRHQLRPATAIVLGIAPCGSGRPRWWVSDGALIPLAYHPRLRRLCADVVASEPSVGARPWRGRGMTPAFSARVAGLPAIAIGCLDEDGLARYSHTPLDTPEQIDSSAVDATLELALLLVDAIDASLATRPGPGPQPGPLAIRRE